MSQLILPTVRSSEKLNPAAAQQLAARFDHEVVLGVVVEVMHQVSSSDGAKYRGVLSRSKCRTFSLSAAE
jgi:hypothetical protein